MKYYVVDDVEGIEYNYDPDTEQLVEHYQQLITERKQEIDRIICEKMDEFSYRSFNVSLKTAIKKDIVIRAYENQIQRIYNNAIPEMVVVYK